MQVKTAAQSADAWIAAWARLLDVGDRHPRLVVRAARAMVLAPARGLIAIKGWACEPQRKLLTLMLPALTAAGVAPDPHATRGRRRLEDALDDVAPAVAAAIKGYKSELARPAVVLN